MNCPACQEAIRGQRWIADGAYGSSPVWSPDGESIYYLGIADTGDIWRKRADLSGEAELVYGGGGSQMPQAFSADGTRLVVMDDSGSTWDVVRAAYRGADMIRGRVGWAPGDPRPEPRTPASPRGPCR